MPASSARKTRRKHFQSCQSSDTSDSVYRYQPLPTAASIRVLEISPSSEQLECTLTIVSLDDNPTFDALSYSWANPVTIGERAITSSTGGLADVKSLLSLAHIPTASHPAVFNIDPGAMALLSVHSSLPYMDREHGRSRCKTIICNTRPIKITETLYAALVVLRDIIISKTQAKKDETANPEQFPAPRSTKLWIDQICIDQDNISERNLQVPLMNKIFALAQYVFAWIGDLDPLGFEGIQAVINRAKRRGSDGKPRDKDMGYTSYEDDGLRRKELYVLTALLSRQWFRRAWVVQEAIFARRMYIWLGHIFIDWWFLMGALETINEREVSNMTNFTTSLIRREPTGQMSKKLARFERGRGGTSLYDAVTNEEILGYVQGTLSFMRGVVQIKRQLGLQTFVCNAPEDEECIDRAFDAPLDNLVTGFRTVSVEDRAQPPKKLLFMHQPDPTMTSPSAFGWLLKILRDLPEPVTDVSTMLPKVPGKPPREMSIFHHQYKPEEQIKPVPISLFSLITRFRDVGASDPRDKVFAFLHLATETPDLKPDYRATAQAVFNGAAKLLLDRHNLTILSHVQDPLDTKVPDLPSWVPDFSVPLGRKSFVAHDGSSPYSASGTYSGQPNFYLQVIDNMRKGTYEIMATSGWYVDTVADLAAWKGCSLVRFGELALQTPKLYTKGPSALYAQKGRITMRLGESYHASRVEALWRTLIGDYQSDVYPAPVTAGFGFSDWQHAHIHHSSHVTEILRDHFKAVKPEAVREGLKESYTIQTRKKEVFIKLIADEYGGYLCYDCAVEFWNEKMKEYDHIYAMLRDAVDFEPAMVPVRYLPDGDRLSALLLCSRTVPPRREPDGECRCPAFTDAEHTRLKMFENRMQEVKTGRRLFRTKGDLLGMGPKSAQPGDEVWVIMGAKVPFVLRPVDGGKEPKRYTLIGEAYVHGYMDGEILYENKEIQTFGLV